ncbi:LrgB family protein [Paenibacillus albiflavus]|uniref:LrgB family protein n=1 Tax=Paenibacillus albiflavus TaxID=2545760 RepID=A0A4R4E0G0_9BACL|nr:LrgB family protein [Paenibacillus albiflavus]TCZ67506.1 LrgB family protein [Paenibacillus albiflavus]
MLNLLYSFIGIAITIAAYFVALRVNKRLRWVHPLFICAGSIMTLLVIGNIPYEYYKLGGDVIAFCLGPATVALGVPLYKNRELIRKHAFAIISGVSVGSAAGIISAGSIVWLMGGNLELMLSMMPKSTTAPIAIEISRQLGGIPELSAIFAVLTGLIGSMIGTGLLRVCRIQGDVPIGIAMGTAAHGIGTAAVIRHSEFQGSLSGLAMGLAGIASAILFIPLYGLFH